MCDCLSQLRLGATRGELIDTRRAHGFPEILGDVHRFVLSGCLDIGAVLSPDRSQRTEDNAGFFIF
jgi:hypothetical protein